MKLFSASEELSFPWSGVSVTRRLTILELEDEIQRDLKTNYRYRINFAGIALGCRFLRVSLPNILEISKKLQILFFFLIQVVRMNHSECREHICANCFQKAKCKLTPRLIKALQEFIYLDYNPKVMSWPTGICKSCESVLNNFARGNFSTGIRKPVGLRLMNDVRIFPRSKNCRCQICYIAKLNGQEFLCHLRRNGNPTKSPTIKLCPSCLGVVARGVSHVCTNRTRIANVQDLLTTPEKEKIASEVLRTKKLESKEFTLNTYGRPSKIDFSQPVQQVSLNQMAELQLSLGFTQNQVLGVAKHVRKTLGKGSVEPNLKPFLQERNKKCEDFFAIFDWNEGG